MLIATLNDGSNSKNQELDITLVVTSCDLAVFTAASAISSKTYEIGDTTISETFALPTMD